MGLRVHTGQSWEGTCNPDTFKSYSVSLKFTDFKRIWQQNLPVRKYEPVSDIPQYTPQTTQLIIWTGKWLSWFLGQFTDGQRTCSFLARTLVCQPINQRPSVEGVGRGCRLMWWGGGALPRNESDTVWEDPLFVAANIPVSVGWNTVRSMKWSNVTQCNIRPLHSI